MSFKGGTSLSKGWNLINRFSVSRHLYDIQKIMDTDFGEAIADRELYDAVVKHRSVFNKLEGVDYKLHNPSTLSFIPPESIIKEWKKDYQTMQNHFIYEERSLSFEELIKRLEELAAKIRNL